MVRLVIAFMLCATMALLLPALCVAAQPALPAGVSEQVASLGDLLPSSGSAGKPGTNVIGQVERVALGSDCATVTLRGGKQIRLDFAGLTGIDGGPNYLGWAMLLMGASVATRLLSSLARVLRPISMVSRRRRDRFDDDDY